MEPGYIRDYGRYVGRRSLSANIGEEQLRTIEAYIDREDGWTLGADGIYHDATGLMTWRVADGWTHLQDNVYYRELAPNTALDAGLIDDGAVNVSENMTRTQLQAAAGTLHIRVKAAAVQREGGDTAQIAWKRLGGR